MRVWSLGREDPLEEGMANPLQYSCLENPKDRGAWWATVHGVAKSQTWLKWLSTHARVMAAWVKTMRHITKAYDSWLTHQMSWVEGKGGFKEEQRKEGGREASSSSSIWQEACFLGAYPAGGWFLSPHCNPCIWGSLKNGSTCLFQNISGVVIVQNLLWVMKKRELSLTNSDYHHHPSHSPVIPNQFISIQPWNSSCYPVSISHLSFNSKFKNPVIPFTNEFFWFGSRIKVPWIRLLIFFFFYKECSKFEPFYLYISLPRHAHRHGQGGDVKSTLRLWPAPSLRLTLTVLIFRHHPFSCCPQQRHPTVSFTFILDSLQDTVCRVLGDLKSVNQIMSLSA